MPIQDPAAPQNEVARETEALRASTRTLHDTRLAIEAENAALEALLLKQTKFVQQMERFLAAAEKKRKALDREKERVLHDVVGACP